MSLGRRAAWLLVAIVVGCADGAGPADVTSSSLGPSPDTSCIFYTSAGRDYWFCANLRNWQTARTKCQGIGLDLTTIGSSTENTYIRTRLLIPSWIGANDIAVEGQWRWAQNNTQFWQGLWNGSAVGGAYKSWQLLEPSNTLNQDCGTTSALGGWTDESCTTLRPYVCEGVVDLCLGNPNKVEPGQCGCDTADTDFDGDGTADCNDGCRFDAAKIIPGSCGCGTPDSDADGDGVLGCNDDCPTDPRYVTLGDCGCSDHPAASGTSCNDGLCAANTTCDGAGTCGNPVACKPDTGCSLYYFHATPYWFCDNDRGYGDAEQRCQTSGMRLAVIESASEDAFITANAHEHSFLGGSDNTVEGKWMWASTNTQFWSGGATGSAFGGAYTNFAWLEPSELLSDNDCLIKSLISGGQWKAHACFLSDAYVCERVDACTNDPQKDHAGQCGCGIPDSDSDGDGIADCRDACGGDPTKSDPGTCGCDEPDTDTDADGIADCLDECPLDNDVTAGGTCGCPSNPTPTGTLCCDGICGTGECDGDGHCGDAPSTCSPDPACNCSVIRVDGTAYWFCPCAKDRDAAEAACETNPGRQLLQITGPSENAMVAARLTGDAWIGANDRGVEGEFRWTTPQHGDTGPRFWDGAATGGPHFGRFATWQANEPGGGTGSNCAAMSSATATRGTWFDTACTATAHVACEAGLERLNCAPLSLPSACESLGQKCETTRDDVNCVPAAQAFAIPADPEAQRQQFRECTWCVDCFAPIDPVHPRTVPCAPNPDVDCLTHWPDPNDPSDPIPCDGSAAPPPANSTCGGFDDGLPPNHQFLCSLVPGSWGSAPVTNCETQACASGSCGIVFSCSTCAGGTAVCPCEKPEDCAEQGDQCVARKVCGTLIPECPTFDAEDGPCEEIEICATDTLREEHTFVGMNPTSDLRTVPTGDIEAEFGQADMPTNAIKLPDNSPCPDEPDPQNCASDQNHRWCRYDTPQEVLPRTVSSPMRNGDAGDPNSVKFYFTPDIDYGYQFFPGPLGLMQFQVDARASLSAGVEFKIFDTPRQNLKVIDFLLEARGGLRDSATNDDDDLCGISAGNSRLLILDHFDVLPASFKLAMDIPGESAQLECIQGLKDFQNATDRAKKAYMDARELLRQHDVLKVLNSNFGTGLDGFCDQIFSSLPLGFPPAIRDNCLTLRPEEILNAFITYYRDLAVDTLANEVAGRVADTIDVAFDQTKLGIPLTPELQNTEEITLFNQTFLVGPIPVNLQVLMTVGYGLKLDGVAKFQPSSLIRDMIFSTATSADPLMPSINTTTSADPENPFAYIGVTATPEAAAGIALFAGAGFDAGIAAAAIGIEGSVSVGRISLPLEAGAGIAISSEPDTRPLADDDMAAATYVSVAERPLIPLKKFSINATYKFGASLKLQDVLSGSIDAVVRLKFLFFSRRWRAHIVSFTGFCAADDPDPEPFCNVDLFGGYGTLAAIPVEMVDWGTVLQPTAFLQLKPIAQQDFRPPGSASIDTGRVGELFFDSLCTCIPRPVDLPSGQTPKACSISSDCCGYETGDFCFDDPIPDAIAICTTCRAQGQSCTSVSDCCATDYPQTCLSPPDGSQAYGTCQPKSACMQPCSNNDDCDDSTGKGDLFCFTPNSGDPDFYAQPHLRNCRMVSDPSPIACGGLE